MFFILSKTISILVMPVYWLIAIFLYALFVKNPKRKKRAFRLVFFLFLILTNPFIINTLLLGWEIPPTKISDLKESYQVGIVLTGITKNLKSPHDRTYLDNGADRIMHTLQLYRLGKIKKILITGATIDVFGKVRTSEAQLLANILLQAKVPKEDIILDENAKNTRENALNSKAILDKQFPKQTYLLITSAFHMRRALGCFQKVGLEVEVFSAGFLTYDFAETKIASFFPSEYALNLWYILFHECLGYMVYGGIGYL